jgi:hypothetical protein
LSTPEPQPIPAGASAPTAAATAAPPVLTPKVSDIINLYSGKEMSEAEAQKMAMERPVRLIVTGGPIDFGKTTLLAALYELFQKGPVAGQRFASSQTLPAFEEKCHYARQRSRNSRIDTPRTVYKPDPYYVHLRTASIESPASFTDLLITDVSGEMFENAANKESECKRLIFIKRATHFLLLFDTSKALGPGRWSMLQKAQTLLRSFLDHGMLSARCVVTVVWSKVDYFEAASQEDKKALEEFRVKVKQDFETDFRARVADLQYREIAAQPLLHPDFKMGKGVPALLTDWIADRPARLNLNPREAVGTRESELFGQRYNLEEA